MPLGLGFGIWGSGFGVRDLGFGIWDDCSRNPLPRDAHSRFPADQEEVEGQVEISEWAQP